MSGDSVDPGSKDQSESGVIDIIGIAFGKLNQRPYLIWLPVFIDLLVWTGTRVYVTPSAFEAIFRRFDSFNQRTANIELMSLATWSIPNLLGHGQFSEVQSILGSSTFTFSGYAGVGLLLAGSGLSLMLLVIWMTILGRLVSDASASDISMIRDARRLTWQFVAAAFLVALMVVFLSIPVFLFGAGLVVMDVSPNTLITLGVAMLATWLALFFAFSIPALVIGERRVACALRSSYQLVHQNFLAVIGLLLIIVIVRAGVPHALSIFSSSQWSVPFAIVVNAYVVTGMLTAVLLFYQRRSERSPLTPSNSPVLVRG
jgi:hypothetical protein